MRDREGIYLLCIFLVATNDIIKGELSYHSLDLALDDFIEQYFQESKDITIQDISEIANIRSNPDYLVKSYLFEKIEPFLLPFYTRNKRLTF